MTTTTQNPPVNPPQAPVVCPYATVKCNPSFAEKIQPYVTIGVAILSLFIAWSMNQLDSESKKIALHKATPSIQSEYLVYTRTMGYEDTEFTDILSNQVKLPNSSVNAQVCDTGLLPEPLSDDELMRTDPNTIQNQFVLFQSITETGDILLKDVTVSGYLVPDQHTDLKVGWNIHRSLFMGYGLPEITQKYPDITVFELGDMNPKEQILIPLAGAVAPSDSPDSAITIFVPTKITFIDPTTMKTTTLDVPRANSVITIDRCWETS